MWAPGTDSVSDAGRDRSSEAEEANDLAEQLPGGKTGATPGRRIDGLGGGKGSAVTVEDGTAYASRFQAQYAGTALRGEPSYNLCMPITSLDRGLHAQQPNLKPSGGPQ
jgi:hypothetical protein